MPSAQAERAGLSDGRRHRPDFRERALAAENEERFARLDPPEEGKEVALKVLHADGTHALIVAEHPCQTSRNGRREHRFRAAGESCLAA